VRWRFAILLAITLAGAGFRFVTLDRPPLWGDEALTYSRVCGSLDEMFDILRYDGFMPLHYELYWWLGHGMPIGHWQLTSPILLTPKVMRIIPALCGTLMIPAIYFATRQLASVRAALLAAALACVSAYTMAYSHDAKMYVQTWFFVTLNLGCFGWWIRTRGLTAWLAWIATGLAACGFHIAAALMVAPQVLMFLTARHARWPAGLAMLLGLAVIAAGPIGYYSHFNEWNQRTGGLLPGASSPGPETIEGNWDESGIAWVEDRTRDTTGPELLTETASVYLIGTEWTDPDRHTQSSDPVVSPRVHRLVGHAFIAALAAIALGLLPWRAAWRSGPRASSLADPPIQPAWRVFLWLSLLLIVPIYGFFYCRSVHGFVSPMDWLDAARPFAASPFVWLAAAVLIYFSGYTMAQRLARLVQFTAVVATIIALCGGLYLFWQFQLDRHWQHMRDLHGNWVDAANSPELDWKSVWMPRYSGVVWPAMAIACAILLARIPTIYLRWPAVAVVLAINGGNAACRLLADTQPPQPRIFADVAAVRDSHESTRIVMTSLDPDRRGRTLWFHASNYGLYGDAGRYFACIALGLEPSPSDFRNGLITNEYRPWLGDLVPPENIPNGIATRETNRLIIWERYQRFQEPEELPADDDIVQSLGPTWKLARRPEIFRLRNWHDWGDMGWMRRREFVRNK
jgi:hypothetical protein